MTITTVPLRRIFFVRNGGTPLPDAENWGGSIPWATPVDLGEADGELIMTHRTLTTIGARHGSTIAPPHSILLSTRAPIGHLAVSTTRTAFNQGCRALIPRMKVDLHYFRYQLEAARDRLMALGQGTTFSELPRDALQDCPIFAPDYPRQREIRLLLDTKLTVLERLRGEYRKMARIARELEQSSIADEMSGNGGGTCNTHRSATGWEWLPSIPSNWTVRRVADYYDAQLGKMLSPRSIQMSNHRPYLRNANVSWYSVNYSDLPTMGFTERESYRYALQAGDLLVREGGSVGEAALWNGEVAECCYQNSLHRVRPKRGLPVEWLMYWLRLAKSCGLFEATGNVSTIAHLTLSQLRKQELPVPDDAGARVIRLREKVRKATTLRALCDRAETLLAERRRALITAAVAGQIDVSTASGRGVMDGLS